MEGIPSELIYQSDTGVLSVKYTIAGESKLVMIDKSGKLMK
jgi:hypothetical protein